MGRIPVIVLTMFAIGEPALGGGEVDLWKYAITQGGLLIVVFVLLWNMRQDQKRKDERIGVLTELVASNTAAMTKGAEAMGRAIELLRERR